MNLRTPTSENLSRQSKCHQTSNPELDGVRGRSRAAVTESEGCTSSIQVHPTRHDVRKFAGRPFVAAHTFTVSLRAGDFGLFAGLACESFRDQDVSNFRGESAPTCPGLSQAFES